MWNLQPRTVQVRIQNPGPLSSCIIHVKGKTMGSVVSLLIMLFKSKTTCEQVTGSLAAPGRSFPVSELQRSVGMK